MSGVKSRNARSRSHSGPKINTKKGGNVAYPRLGTWEWRVFGRRMRKPAPKTPPSLPSPPPSSELPKGYPRLGEWEWKGLSISPAAYPHFTLGLKWLFTYNHEEARHCFEVAHEIDPQAPIPLWGIAYCLGPNYNLPWDFLSIDIIQLARKFAIDAMTLAQSASPLEKMLCDALLRRYPSASKASEATMQQWTEDYADAMDAVQKEHPDSIDVMVLTAEAFMSISPWKLWNIYTGHPSPAPSKTLETAVLLERAMALVKEKNLPHHTGALHLYIHLMEMSHTPEKALPAYDVLVSGICPDAAHLLHMGTHIGILCGEYHKAVQHNREAVVADKHFFNYKKQVKSFYVLYTLHNLHFMCYGAMFAGDIVSALEAANGIREIMDEEMLQWNKISRFADTYCAVKYHALVRFGRWEDILAEPFPANAELCSYQTCVLHYTRALAFALGRNDTAKAEAECALFEAAYERVPPGRGRMLHNNTGRDLLDVAREMMYGEVMFRAGRMEEGVRRVERAVAMEDNLPYDEPWGVMQPTRHALGALLLEMGRAAEALVVFNEDLGRGEHGGRLPRVAVHVDNIWAMLGVADATHELKRPLDPSFARRLQIQMKRADPSIKAACFCRLAKCKACPSSL